MDLTLENQYLRVEITSIGAELTSIFQKETNREYLWNADPAVWDRHSPILFPNCGQVKDGRFLIEGKEYRALQHGFAKDLDHKLVCTSEELATLRLENSSKTTDLYPYRFAMKTTYKLEKNSLRCQHKVINYDTVPIYFSVGFHTGIRCPFVVGTQSSDYTVVFQQQEDCTRLFAHESGLISHREEPYRPQSRRIPITPGVFSDSLILKNIKSEYIQLEEKHSGDYLRIDHTNSPFTVLWSAPEDVGTVCIEPWYGMGDLDDTDGQLAHKLGINCLDPREEFVCEQVIKLGNSNKPDKSY